MGVEGLTVELGQTLQRVADLKFVLYRRPLHPELFCIHESRHLERGTYQADIWVMGLSHVVTVQSAGRCVTEVTTEDIEVLPQNGLVTTFPFRGERDHLEKLDDGMHYILSTQVERMNRNLFHASHRDLMHYGATRGMLVKFENWVHDDNLVPFSFIDWELRDRELHVQAFHSFPADYTILKTQSIFEVGPPPKPKQSR
ncbi:MAG: DUF2617 family protein [Phycisphaerae bacterium]|nr:DUF2617 family protein [Phycisphaerae bacterium]